MRTYDTTWVSVLGQEETLCVSNVIEGDATFSSVWCGGEVGREITVIDFFYIALSHYFKGGL